METLGAGGQTYEQSFRVERVGTGDNAAMAESDDQSDDDANINGGIFPKKVASAFTY